MTYRVSSGGVSYGKSVQAAILFRRSRGYDRSARGGNHDSRRARNYVVPTNRRWLPKTIRYV